MPGFDLRTIIMMSSIMLGLMGVVMSSLARSFPHNIHGVDTWVGGAFVLSGSAILVALRGMMPDVLSIVVANCGIVAGNGLWLIGTQRFFARRTSGRLVVLMVALSAPVLSWLTWQYDSVGGRTICVTAALVVLYGAQTAVMLGSGWRHRGARLLTAMFAMMAGASVVRLVSILSYDAAPVGVFSTSLLQVFYVTVNTLLSLTASVGFLLLAMHRWRAQLEQQSRIDPLTGLLNRRAFLNLTEPGRAAAQHDDGPLSLLLIDLDHFKAVNDTWGHVTGDEILRDFSTRVAAMLPDRYPFARWGGEEFVVLLPRTPLAQARPMIERMHGELMMNLPLGQISLLITLSLGATEYRVSETWEQTLQRADKAMLQAKRSGRSRYVLD